MRGKPRIIISAHLKLISFLKLVGVLVLAVVHLLSLDVGVHPVLLHVSSGIFYLITKSYNQIISTVESVSLLRLFRLLRANYRELR